MRIFLIGDYTTGTGPANVTRDLLKNLPSDTLYLRHWNKVFRTIEIVFGVPKSDVIVLSGYSRQNLLALRIAAFYHKPTCYLMHGCVEYENEINDVVDTNMNHVERKTLQGADLILGVSRQFRDWLKEYYPEHATKIGHLTNGVDWRRMRERATADRRDPKQIFSVGGGMPRKRIRVLCKAIELLNKRGFGLRLVVAGDSGKDTEEIHSYPFVEDVGLVSQKEIWRYYHTSTIFVQNSCFETFGLAPLEALLSGCDILVSRAVGAISIFREMIPSDVIQNPEDPEEIAEKLAYLLEHENHSRLLVELDKESTSWEARAKELQTILSQLKEKKS